MSYTDIFSFDKAGNAHLAGVTRNAWRGGMMVWRTMEERHLPPYIPEYVRRARWYRHGMTPAQIEEHLGFMPTRTTTAPTARENPLQAIWDLADNPAIPEHERIVLFTTFDHCLVKRENAERVIEAFRAFGGDTSLPEQADIIEKLIRDENCIAIGWNQTSVNAETWSTAGGYDDENDGMIPYNCLTGTTHYWLFDELGKGAAQA